MSNSTATLRVYVADLAAYSAGSLKGAWVNLAGLDEDEMREAFETAANGNEWAIHDYELAGIRISEYPNLEKLAETVEGIKEHGNAYIAYRHHVDEADASLNHFEDCYRGTCDSPAEYFENLEEDCGGLEDIPERFRNYINWESMAEDARLSGELSFVQIVDGTADPLTYVFSNR